MNDTALWGLAFAHACTQVQTLGYGEETVFTSLRAVMAERCAGHAVPEWWLRTVVRQAYRYTPHELDPAMGPYGYHNRGDGYVFAQLHRDHIRYDHARGRWLIYDGAYWAPDQIDRLREYAAQCAKFRTRQAEAIEDPEIKKAALRWTRKGLHTGQVDYMLREARSIPPIADPGDEWDTDPWLLGVPNGVVDLRTGVLRDGRPEDRITLQTAVPYDQAAKAPLWEATLAAIFSDKPEGFLPYLQRALGYSCTGCMDEEVFWLLVGIGRNGKGTVINTVHKVLGTYADALKFSSLEASRNGTAGAAATPDLAKLDGKRLVVASEGSGAALYTALIKQITGRDPMTVRALYKDERTFTPVLKLWLTAQSQARPRVKDDSDGFWSRPHEIQFSQSYKDKADTGLKERLYNEEAQGILAWLVRGAVEWRRQKGLKAPACVTQAVQDYRLSQEPLADFYADACVLEPQAITTFAQLYAAYLAWGTRTKRQGLYGTHKFGKELGKRFKAGKDTTSGRTYLGIGLAVVHDPGPQGPGPGEERQPGGDDDLPF